MAKIKNDKYYTPPELAKYIISKTKEIIGEDNITEYVEPSAGAGVFLDYLDKPYLAYDIEPEDDRIIRQDYLELDIEYKKGRCVIGNPPYGRGNTLSVKFFKKSIEIADYIAFILPISQYKNNQQMYEFDLIYSEDLGVQKYTDRNLHCCFNIYKRPRSGEYNKKPNYKLKDVNIIEYRRNIKKDMRIYNKASIGICAYGSGIVGKIPKYVGEYVKEMYFVINNKKYEERIIEIIKNTNWEQDVCRGMSGQLNLAQWQVYKHLKEQIPELK